MKTFRHILLLLLVATACQGARVIPRDKLADVYFDMFMADQQIRELGLPSTTFDSLLVYEPIFEKYGYDTDDYLHSVRYYLKDPERFAKIFEDVGKRLEGEAKSLEPLIEHRNWVAQQMGTKRPRLDSILSFFSKDSLYVGRVRVERDSSRYGALYHFVGILPDSLRLLPMHSPLAAADSTKAPADTVAKDSVEDVEDAELPAGRGIQETRIQYHPRRLKERELIKEEVVAADEEVAE